jgi:hypothetical protein
MLGPRSSSVAVGREPQTMSATGRLPTFVIIGAQKSGTRWLKSNLEEHPDVFVAPGEPGYFHDPQRMRSLGPDWYRAQFAEAAGAKSVGEGTPGYMIWHHRPADIAERIDEHVPDVRVVAILRNPVDRVRSAFLHYQKWGDIPQDADLMTVVRGAAASGAIDSSASREFVPGWGGPQTLVTGGWYGASLSPYAEAFGDRLAIVLHDDVLADPLSVYRRVLEHLDLDPSFVPRDLEAHVFTNSKRRGGRKRAPALTDDQREELGRFFEADLATLEALTGRDLASWRSV